MSTREKILKLLKQATKPLTLEQIAMIVKVDKEDVQEELDRLFIADKIKTSVNLNRKSVYSLNEKKGRR